MKIKAILLLLLIPMLVHAQWRVGITGGPDYNGFSRDTHGRTFNYKGTYGWSAGVMGQYDIMDWLGVRAELNWTQKNNKAQNAIANLSGVVKEYFKHKEINSYIQLPLMAALDYEYKQWRGLLNLGGYGAWWMARDNDFDVTLQNVSVTPLTEPEFVKERDQRCDFGFVGGIGIERRINQHFSCQVEARCYYSTTSTQKDYMRIKDPRYNTTYTLQLAVCYIF